MAYIVAVQPNRPQNNIGGKASQIRFLLEQGVTVPQTWVIKWDAFLDARRDKTAVLQQLRIEMEHHLELARPYAVRSSANVEDSQKYSFAGQFDSILNVAGIENLLAAIEQVWHSVDEEDLKPYLAQADRRFLDIKMAVILQEMVNPIVSGVAFSKNPMTGTDEQIIEALPGSGEVLVQEGVTPLRWVNKWGKWLQESSDEQIPKPLIETVVRQTRQLAAAFEAPVDLEWVWDGTAVYWVQIREITTLKDLNIYSNRISREVMPGIIKPLIWSINVPLVNGAWIQLIQELVGATTIKPEDLAHAFHYRSYFNMSTLGKVFMALGMPTETLELMMGLTGGEDKPRFKPSSKTFKHLPRMVRFLLNKLWYQREIDQFLPQAEAKYEQFAVKDLSKLSQAALLEEVDALFEFTQRMAYVNVVGPLIMLLFNNRFQKQLEKLGIDYAAFDLMDNVSEMEKYDPAVHLERLNARFARLPIELQEEIKTTPFYNFVQMPSAREFREQLIMFSARFGHFSDSGNDFSAETWRESPTFLLKMVINHQPTQTAVDKKKWSELPLSPWQRLRLNASYHRARRWRLYRERISYDYTFGYGLFRNIFLELAKRLQNKQLILEVEDIFYLYFAEVKQLAADESQAPIMRTRIGQRRQEIERVREAILPDIIYGEQPPPIETAVEAQSTLMGIPTSRGYFQGSVCVIESVQAFDKMEPGAVLVIPYSDVSWTPLFAKAGAVIAESGGMLSHSSIVAREFGLPAVVSVTHACRILEDGAQVVVDGFKGIVKVSGV